MGSSIAARDYDTRPSTLTQLDSLWSAIEQETGAARNWHLQDLSAHQARYCSDLRIVAELDPAGTLLEIGSAPCHMTSLLALAGYRVIGVDLAPHRVASLIERMHLEVKKCDVERTPLPFGDGEFGG